MLGDTKSKPSTCIHVSQFFNPHPEDKILDWSKLKEIADDILSAFQMKNKCYIG